MTNWASERDFRGTELNMKRYFGNGQYYFDNELAEFEPDEQEERVRTKAEFRAIREQVGISQSGLAKRLHVEVRSVKRWESPDAPQQPIQPAWEIVDRALDKQRIAIIDATNKVKEIEKDLGHKPESVTLTYWYSEKDYLQNSTDAKMGVAGDWKMANANTRAIAAILWDRGYEVRYDNGIVPTTAEPTE